MRLLPPSSSPSGYAKRSSWLALAVLIAVSPAARAGASAPFRLQGRVTDGSGAAVRNAQIELDVPGLPAVSTTSGSDGGFEIDGVAAPSAELIVRAPGFREMRRHWEASNARVEVKLTPAGAQQEITVSATRAGIPLSDAPASVIIVAGDDLRTRAAPALDDALRLVPGFSLFRRSGSRFANPTTLGASLRGVGSSGASRAVTLVDGVPLNDPFGGWVYWDRVPFEDIGRVEVVRGGASALYGADALAGVVSIARPPARENTLSLTADFGSQNQAEVSARASGKAGPWAGSIAGEAFTTDGYVVVEPASRGRVDTPANSQHRSLEVGAERRFGQTASIFARGSLFRDARHNGTPLQANSAGIGDFVVGGQADTPSAGSLALRVFGMGENFSQSFTSVATDRNSEALTRTQQAPAQQAGLSLQWWRAAGPHTLVAGFEGRDVRGHSDELGYSPAGVATSESDGGGRQRYAGLFVGDLWHAAPRLTLNLSSRYDHWSNTDALRRARPLAGAGARAFAITPFADRSEDAFSPRAGLVYRVNSAVGGRAGGYTAFRAPTLNELYRSFRVGNVVTNANENLRAETLTGGEGGVAIDAGGLTLRSVFFWAEVDQPIASVTLSSTPALITRQRQNLGSTRSRGLDVDAQATVLRRIQLFAGYEYANAEVVSFAADRSLQGLDVPQAPRHQFTFSARYSAPHRPAAAVQGRWAGRQFDDDRNQFPLNSFFTLDAFVSCPVHRNAELFAAVENIFDARYDVARTPVRTIGPPVIARGGVRLRFGNR